MAGKALRGRGRRVVARAILDQDDRLGGLRQHPFQEGTIALRVEAPAVPTREQPSREVVDQSEDLVAFTLPSRLDQWLLAAWRPSVRQRAPLGEAGFIPKQQQGARAPRPVHERGPGLPQPCFALLWVEMIGDKARLLVGEAQVAQQFADILDVIHHAKLAPNQRLQQGSMPTAGGIAGRRWTSGDQVAQGLLLSGGQFGGTPRGFASLQTGKAVQE